MTSIVTLLVGALLAQASQPALRTPAPKPARGEADALALQVALDRAGFSPGVIDGRLGANTRRALEAYRERHGSDPALEEPLARYEIAASDANGPFVENIPSDLMLQAQLPSLSYTSVVEAVAERFHTTTEFLRSLNREARFVAGEHVQVPNVDPFVVPGTDANAKAEPTGTAGRAGRASDETAGAATARPDVVVSVSKRAGAVTVKDAEGRTLMFAPVTTGSENDPLPLGEWKVTGVQYNPQFRYNPDLFWDADPGHSKATLPPGPNNPVGVVWIDLSKEHYGFHGTPEPGQIGRTASHGCVRLTNWDALRLARLVRPGTRVVFEE
jgi:lipoprotein-anchoring transpeptidase ErfK/SrfK